MSCPSCGRTLFDLQEVTEQIRTRTGHLPGQLLTVHPVCSVCIQASHCTFCLYCMHSHLAPDSLTDNMLGGSLTAHTLTSILWGSTSLGILPSDSFLWSVTRIGTHWHHVLQSHTVTAAALITHSGRVGWHTLCQPRAFFRVTLSTHSVSTWHSSKSHSAHTVSALGTCPSHAHHTLCLRSASTIIPHSQAGSVSAYSKQARQGRQQPLGDWHKLHQSVAPGLQVYPLLSWDAL